jgi:hypothetical protein
MGTWTPMYNSVEYLYDGAFNRHVVASDPFDFGWGIYNMVTHHIVGDSLFIMKTVAGNYKKVWIEEKDPNMGANFWYFKFADLDGSNEQSVTLEGDMYTGKNYIYYSLDNNAIVDKEPDSEDWELQFTKYFDYNIPYYVTGVLANSERVVVQQVDDVDQPTFEDYDESMFTDIYTEIGSDWKEFNMNTFQYELDENRVYFIKELQNDGVDSTYWKLYFTGFTGTSEGKYTFEQKQLASTLSIFEERTISLIEVYPNPASDKINLVVDANGEAIIRIMDLSGRIVFNNTINSQGFDHVGIDVSHLIKGYYLVTVEINGAVSQSKFVKQ